MITDGTLAVVKEMKVVLGGVGVLVLAARLMEQRHLCVTANRVAERQVIKRRLLQLGAERQAAGMAHDFADGDGVARAVQQLMLFVLLGDDPQVFEFRQMLFDRIIEAKLALVHKDHQSQSGNGLGH